MDSDLFNVNSVTDQLPLFLQLAIIHLFYSGEAPHLTNKDSLLSGEFMLASSEGLNGDLDVLLLAPDGEQGLADGDPGGTFHGLSVGPTHTRLQTIGACAGEHLVDTDDVPRVDAAAHVESVFSGVFGQVLVGSDTGGFQSVGGDLLSEGFI